MSWVVDYHDEVKKTFLDLLNQVPSWGPEVDKEMSEYIGHIANLPRGCDCWNFEGGRYFGDKGREIQETRWVHLLPKFVT